MTTDTQAPKPPLSDPMAEARAEDAAQAAATAAAEAARASGGADPADDAAGAGAGAGDGSGAAQAPEEIAAAATAAEAAKADKKSPVKQLQGRVGYLTKQLHDRDAAAAELAKQNEAMRALLEAQAPGATLETPPAKVNGAKSYTDADLNARAEQIAAAKEFNRQADAAYDAGKAKFSDWQESVDNLVATGHMTPPLLEAALATDDAAAVIHHLGSDVDEAARIVALPPARMGAELAKLAAKLSAPKHTPISGAPPPIKPVTGSAAPAVDFRKLAESDDMASYVAARKAAGDKWAR